MMNKVLLIGNVGQDPAIRETGTGKKVASFSLATSETSKNEAGERVSVATWHNITAWEGLAEIMEKYVKKGQQLYVEGRIVYQDYTDKEGIKRYRTEIVAYVIKMLGGKKAENTEAAQPETDLPF